VIAAVSFRSMARKKPRAIRFDYALAELRDRAARMIQATKELARETRDLGSRMTEMRAIAADGAAKGQASLRVKPACQRRARDAGAGAGRADDEAPGMTHRRDPTLADPTARALLDHVRRLGYHVSVHLLPSSPLGTVPACVELHAVVVGTGEQLTAKAAADEPDAEYRCACALVKMVRGHQGG
jgi:hypothetical protein